MENSFISNFRNIKNQKLIKDWFWENYNWNKNSIWIGKFINSSFLLDNSNTNSISQLIETLINDLSLKVDKKTIYFKIYHAKNIKNNNHELNFLLISNTLDINKEFNNTLINIMFESYQITKEIFYSNNEFKEIINHYLLWSNYFKYFNLLNEITF
jgi:hypothetical protein